MYTYEVSSLYIPTHIHLPYYTIVYRGGGGGGGGGGAPPTQTTGRLVLVTKIVRGVGVTACRIYNNFLIVKLKRWPPNFLEFSCDPSFNQLIVCMHNQCTPTSTIGRLPNDWITCEVHCILSTCTVILTWQSNHRKLEQLAKNFR